MDRRSPALVPCAIDEYAGGSSAVSGVAVGLLRDTSGALAGASDLAVMLQRCVQAIVDRLDAAFARIWTVDPEGETLLLQASAGMYTHIDGGHARVPIGAFKIGRIAARRAPHLTNDVLDDPELSDPDWARREGMVAFAGYPLLAGTELVGVLGLFARHELADETTELLGAVGDSIALGIRRVGAERQLRQHGETAETLYRVGTTIAQLHKTDAIVRTATDLATELTGARFGAFFSNTLDERGETYTLHTLSGASRDAFANLPPPRKTAIFEATFRGTRIERHADITCDPRFGENEPYCGLPEGHLPVRSYLAVPVVSRTGNVFGGLLLGHDRVGVFDEQAERLALGIAGQTAVALDTARLFELEHRLALNFQRTLLAGDLPSVPGVRFARSYIPASDLAEVGGDWHDVIRLPDGRVALTIGDVVGHDLGAAVTMGRLRNAIQLYAADGHQPSQVLDLTERYMTRSGIEDLATVVHAVYDPTTGDLTMSRAGHPAPVVRYPDGTVAQFPTDLLAGAILGAGVDLPRQQTTVTLQPGTIVLWFTDGLVERRDVGIDERVQQLCAAVAGTADTGHSFCDAIVEAMVGVSPQDDVALLVLFVDDRLAVTNPGPVGCEGR